MRRFLLTALAAAALTLPPSGTAGAQNTGPSASGTVDPELVRRVTEEVLRALREGGALEDEIQRGIERYVANRRASEAEARERAAAAKASKVRRPSAERDHILGGLDAVVSLIEYSDFECPFCKRFHPTARAAIDAYPGKVNWVYRHFPLAFHNPNAQKQAEASECASEQAGNEGFWRFADTLYERTRSNRGFPVESLVPLAVELGLDEARFRDCLDSERFAARVQADMEEGQAAGVSGTPGNILLNTRTGAVRVLPGAVPLARLRQAIEELLAAE